MINHVWGLMTHPETEWQNIKKESNNIYQSYINHVFFMALLPVIFTFIGTTHFGWQFGEKDLIVSTPVALLFGVLFYLATLSAIYFMGFVLYKVTRKTEKKPSFNESVVFVAYTATPMFLSAIIGLYPIVWLCALFGALGLLYTGYLTYKGMPSFLNLNEKDTFMISSTVFSIGVLVLEFLLAFSVLLWSYELHLFT